LRDLISAPTRWWQRHSALMAEKANDFAHELAIGAIFKNEAAYLEEWLEFHHQVGVTRFFLYNNRSTDDWRRVIDPWIRRGIVSVIDWPEIGTQQKAYNHCLRRVRKTCRWIAFVDIDEFLFSPTGRDLPDVLRSYRGQAAIFVYWILFGSSGHVDPPGRSVLASYTRCLDRASARLDAFDHNVNSHSKYVTAWAQDGKSIVNPRLVAEHRVHLPGRFWGGEVLDELGQPPVRRTPGSLLPCSVLRINHYWSKSLSELEAKVRRGNANRKQPASANGSENVFIPADPAPWFARERDLNKAEDRTILELWEASLRRRTA